ncbi:helix-turn-helix domain-containing protein [Tissierella sp.]|uniref:helix-turn-helix domain-containing protein n=1 Tax=Tissierella sp. TaxID=41274 RepID=UPI003042ABC2
MKKINTYDDYRQLIDVERLEKQIKYIRETVDFNEEVETLLKFFKLLYPSLDELNKYKKKEEILQIALFYISPKLNKELKGNTRGQRGISSYNTYVPHFLKDELNKYFYSLGAYNVYYSLGLSLQNMKNNKYNPNASKEDKLIDKNIGREYIKVYRNNNENTLYLGALAIDIDASNIEDLQNNIKRCDEIEDKFNINSIKINSSLTGQQRVYLLDKLYTDKTLLEQFMKSFYEAGVNVDPVVKDISRILRLPVGLNVKAFDPSKGLKVKDVFKVKWINEDEDINRYSPDFLISSLKSLKVRDFEDIEDNKKEIRTTINKEKKQKHKLTYNPVIEPNELKEHYIFLPTEYQFKDLYNSLSYKEIPESILKMLFSDFKIQGYRNNVLRALNYYLDFMYPLPLSEKQKIFILSTFGNQVKLENKEYQVNYVRENKQYLKPNDKELVEIFGKIDINIYKKGDYVYISNMLIDKFKFLKGNSFSLFLKMLIDEVDNGIRDYTIDNFLDIYKVSEKSIKRYLEDLTKSELLVKRKARNKKEGDKTEYYINPKYKDFNLGYEKFRASTVENLHLQLKQNELKVYYYLLLKSNDEGLRKSKRNIAKDLGINHSSITKITNKLEKLGYLKKINEGEGFYQSNRYLIR